MRNTRLDNVISFIGRKNSGKTTLVEQVIDELVSQGIVVSSLKHHSHDDFEIDYPGKDSYRHHAAGTVATAIASARRMAVVEELADPHRQSDDSDEIDLTDVDALLKAPVRVSDETSEEIAQQCRAAISMLPASNLVIVEGYRQAGLPCVELFRQDNPRDVEEATRFVERANDLLYNDHALPDAIVTDIPEVTAAAMLAGVPFFEFRDIAQIARWLVEKFSKPLLSVVIQAGGESRRMKASKALVPFHGRPLIEHMIGRLAPLAADLVVTTNEPEELAYLQVRYPGLRLVRDKFKKRGALPGFITALEAARYPTVAVVACDLVNVSTELIDYEAEFLDTERRTSLYLPPDAVVPMSAQGYEPFCAVYERDRCLEAAIDCWDRRKVRMKNMLEMLNVHYIDADSDPHCPEGCFTNVNTPADLAAVQGKE